MTTTTPMPAEPPPVAFREVECADYKCAACKRRITDGMGCVAVVDGEEATELACSENCAYALVAPVAARQLEGEGT